MSIVLTSTFSEGPGTSVPDSVIPLCVPEMRGNEWKYVKECLDTNWVSSAGAFVDRFEQVVAEYVGRKYAVATVNGTAALHTALLVAGVQPDEEVLVSTLTFIAPANAIRYVGAWPVFIDSEPDYWQMDPQKVAKFLEGGCLWRDGKLHNKATGRRVRAILPVHILGHPVNMDPILEAAHKYDLAVIEDATECLGAKYKERQAGCLGDIACFSFNGNKIITTGGGGMIVTDTEKWAAKARYLTTQAKDDSVEHIHNTTGYNYRLSNIQAALGCAQMEKLNEYIEAKRRIAAVYSRGFKDVPGLTPMKEAPLAFSTFWMYTVLVDAVRFGGDRRTLFQALRETGIETRPLWQPIHLSPAHKGAVNVGGAVAEKIQEKGLSLPCSVGLSALEQDRSISTVIQRVSAR